MKICAVTMVYRDYWALSQWYAHFSKHLGAPHLYIVAHGHDPEIARRCPGASIINVPRDRLDGFDQVRTRMLNGLQHGLSHVYHRVIRTDVDELICLDPDRYASFEELFNTCSSEAVFALGFDVVERSDDAALIGNEHVFAKRRNVIFSGHYSKAFAVSDGTELKQHGVRLPKHKLDGYPFQMPRGVYLAHLKHANMAACSASNTHRKDIASDGHGRPGKAWRIADVVSDRMQRRIETFPHQGWEDAETAAFETVTADPSRIAEENLLRSTFHHFRTRTTLPDWFASS